MEFGLHQDVVLWQILTELDLSVLYCADFGFKGFRMLFCSGKYILQKKLCSSINYLILI